MFSSVLLSSGIRVEQLALKSINVPIIYYFVYRRIYIVSLHMCNMNLRYYFCWRKITIHIYIDTHIHLENAYKSWSRIRQQSILLWSDRDFHTPSLNTSLFTSQNCLYVYFFFSSIPIYISNSFKSIYRGFHIFNCRQLFRTSGPISTVLLEVFRNSFSRILETL